MTRTLQQAIAKARTMSATIGKAHWSTAMINDLPDSAFLYVAPGGSKDESGKTTPRTLRSLPVRGADGAIDLAHLRDALSRIPQSDIPEAAKERATTTATRLLESAQKAVKALRKAKGKGSKPAHGKGGKFVGAPNVDAGMTNETAPATGGQEEVSMRLAKSLEKAHRARAKLRKDGGEECECDDPESLYDDEDCQEECDVEMALRKDDMSGADLATGGGLRAPEQPGVKRKFPKVPSFKRKASSVAKDAQFQKQPVVVSAYQLTEPAQVETMEGTMNGAPGAWMITGVAGENYICDPDIFAQTYAPANDEANVLWQQAYGDAGAQFPPGSQTDDWSMQGALAQDGLPTPQNPTQKDFNSDQERDENGRFGSGSGASKESDKARTASNAAGVEQQGRRPSGAASQAHYNAAVAHSDAHNAATAAGAPAAAKEHENAYHEHTKLQQEHEALASSRLARGARQHRAADADQRRREEDARQVRSRRRQGRARVRRSARDLAEGRQGGQHARPHARYRRAQRSRPSTRGFSPRARKTRSSKRTCASARRSTPTSRGGTTTNRASRSRKPSPAASTRRSSPT
jgi:hypothetical protein